MGSWTSFVFSGSPTFAHFLFEADIQITWPFGSFRPLTAKVRQIRREPCGGVARNTRANKPSWATDVDIIDQCSMFIEMSWFIDWNWQQGSAAQSEFDCIEEEKKTEKAQTVFSSRWPLKCLFDAFWYLFCCHITVCWNYRL